MKQNLELRGAATKKTIARFQPKPYGLGFGDCARMIATHLKNMGRPVVALNQVKQYKSLLGAQRALLAATGHDNLLDAMSEHFPEKAPARCFIGDVIAMPSELPIGALGIYTGNGSVFAYSAESEFPVFGRIIEPIKAWEIL